MNLWRVSTTTPYRQSTLSRLAQGEYAIGTGADAAIPVHGAGISARHAVLVLGESKLQIRVLHPTGEASVNGRPIGETAEVEYPAVLQVGETVVEVARVEEGRAEEATQRIGRLVPRAVEAKSMAVWEQTLRIKRSASGVSEPYVVELKNTAAHTPPEALPEEEDLEETTLHFDMQPAEFEVDRSAWVQMAYGLGKEIAQGGMGRIFAAEDPLLECTVAVKVSRAQGSDGRQQFEREAKILAHLAHPNIVPVHAMGVNSQGIPFYSMKLVRGKTLQRILIELQTGHPEALAQYPLKRLLRVFQKVCDAVGFAHAKGFLHRDLKPENVMSGEFGDVLVMDWGLAQPLKGNSWGAAQIVAESQADAGGCVCIEGTPQYMSPEQAEGLVLDERSDIYALGAVLYAILNKHAPVQGKTLEEVLEKVRRGELSPMTTKRAPFPSLGQNIVSPLGAKVPSALRAVALKALSRDPNDRYGSVAELKADVEAYQNGYATDAESASFLRLSHLWITRHRAASALVLVLILGSLAFTMRLAASVKQARLSAREARQNARKAMDSAKEARDNLAEAEYNAQLADASAREAREQKEHARQETARAQMALAEAAEQDLNAEVMRRVLGKVPEDLRNQEWHYLQQRTDSSDLTIQAPNSSPWLSLMPHPKAPHTFITIQADGWVRRLDLSTGAAVDLFKLDVARLERGAALSPDGERIALARGLAKESPTSPERQQIEVYSLKKPEAPLIIVSSWRYTGAGSDLKFSPNGRFLLRAPKTNRDESVLVLDGVSGALLWERSGDGVCVAGFSEDSAWVYVYSELNGLVALRAPDGTTSEPSPPLTKPQGKGVGFAYSGVENRVAASKNWTALFQVQWDLLRKIDTKDGKVLFSSRLPRGRYSSKLLQFSQVEQISSLATVSPKSEKCGALQLWSTKNGYLIRSMPMYFERKGADEWGILTHPVSREIVVTRGEEMKVWKALATLEETALKVPFLAGFSHKPGFVLQRHTGNSGSAGSSLELQLLDLSFHPPVELAGLSFAGGARAQYGISRNGKILSVRGGDSKSTLLKNYEIQEDGQFVEIASSILPWSFCFAQPSPSGNLVWCWDGVFEARSGKRLVPLVRTRDESSGSFVGDWVNSSRVVEVCQIPNAETPDKKANLERKLLLWNTDSGNLAVPVEDAPDAVAVAAAPDGTQIAEAGSDTRVRIRNGATLKVERQFRAHDEALTAIAWHPNLPLLATSAEDHTLKIWDLRTDTLLESIAYALDSISILFWSPDGASLLATEWGSANSYVFSPKAVEAFTGK